MDAFISISGDQFLWDFWYLCWDRPYSVSPTGNSERESKAADKVRKKIAELEDWEKLDNVETAFVGKLNLNSGTTRTKRNEAEEDVTKVIKAVLDDLDVYSDVRVDVALLVNDLGKHIEFNI